MKLDEIKEIIEKDYDAKSNDKPVESGDVDIKDLPYSLWWKYFAAADVVLLPYKGGIGSGIFADCIATDKPMVGSNIPYFKEFAKDLPNLDVFIGKLIQLPCGWWVSEDDVNYIFNKVMEFYK